MTIAVDLDIKPQTKQKQTKKSTNVFLKKILSKNIGLIKNYSKTCVKRLLLKRLKIGFNTNYRFIKLPFVIKISGLSIFEWLFYTGLL